MKKLFLLCLFLLVAPVSAETMDFTPLAYIDLQVTGIPQVKESCSTINGWALAQHFHEEVEARKKSELEETKTEAVVTASYVSEQDIQETFIDEPKVVNFDDYFNVVVTDGTESYEVRQGYVDAGFILRDLGDYFHHNTSPFVDLFYSIEPGDTVILNGTSYIANRMEYGYLGNFEWEEDGIRFSRETIFTNAGEDIWDNNGTTEIITCTNSHNGRAIWRLV